MEKLEAWKMTLKKSLFEWFSSSSELLELGFTKSQIEQAIKKAKTTLSDLTSDYNFAEIGKSDSYIKSHPENFEVIGETVHTFTEIKYIKGQEWKRDYNAKALQYRTFTNYQTHDGKILEALLSIKFPYFEKFEWDVYALHNEGKNWEIYLKTEFGTLYVPVKALIEKKQKIIRMRMSEYWDWYRKGRDPTATKHNHKKDEHPQHCGLCQQRFYEKEMKPLESKEFKELYKILEAKN